MRFEDEQYVKLYKRDTPTWKAMRWEARALLPLLLRVLDGAGLMECGELGRAAVALMVALPEEVCGPGLADLERLGVLRWHGNVLEMPKFLEGQEARKTESAKKQGQRQAARDKARAQDHGIIQPLSHGVPPCPVVSHDVPLQPSPAQPSSAQLISKKPSPASPSVDGPTDQGDGWQALVDALFVAFVEVHHKPPEPRGKDWKALKRLRGRTKNNDAEILARFRRGLIAQFKQHVDSFWDLDDRWDALASAATGPPQKSIDFRKSPIRAEDVDQSVFKEVGAVHDF